MVQARQRYHIHWNPMRLCIPAPTHTTPIPQISVVQAHQRHLIHWMLMGLCVGMIVAERLYVSHSRAEHENGSFGGVPAGSSRREVMMGE
eukprot:350298-Chlamydomonas_euryale.AAC.4